MADHPDRAASRRASILATSLVGSAAMVSVLLGLLRMKFAAVFVGPAGLGLIGILQSIVATGAILATAGLGQAGARQLAVAAARDDQKLIEIARAALSSATVILALAGFILLWLLRRPIAQLTLNDAESADMIGWLGLAVALTVVASSQTALLSGLRRVADIAKSNIAAGVIMAALAAASVALLRERGILLFVLSAPIATVLAGWWFVRKVGPPQIPVSTGDLMAQWKTLARLGFAFMSLGVLANACQLYIRARIQWDLGTDAVGQFQAGWTVSMQYGALILAGLSADYYPRLTGTIERNEDTQGLVNDQVELTLLLGAPAFVLIAGASPWLVEILFSPLFKEAAEVLRWLVLGDVLRLSITPVMYVLWASGRIKRILFVDGSTYLLMAAITALLLPSLGVHAAGVAYLCAYSFYVIATLFGAGVISGFRLRWRNFFHIAVVFGSCAAVAGLSPTRPASALAAAVVLSTIAALWGYRRLGVMLRLDGGTSLAGQLLSRFRKSEP